MCIRKKIYPIKNGASEYWNAKPLTESNTSGIWVNQFNNQFQINHWMNNLNWYLDSESREPLKYDFIAVDTVDESLKKLVSNVGPPTEIFFCGSTGFYLYLDQQKQKLNGVLGYNVEQYFRSLRNQSPTGVDVLNLGTWETTAFSSTADRIPSETVNPAFSLPTNRAYSSANTLENISFQNEKDPSGMNSEYFLRWKVLNSVDFAFLEKKFEKIESVAGKSLVLSFWARSLNGNLKANSHGYLLPNGFLDSSTLHFGGSDNDTFIIDGRWQPHTLFLNAPALPAAGTNPLSYLVIRTIFFQNSKGSVDIDLAGVRLLANPFETAPPEYFSNYSPYNNRTGKELLELADNAFNAGQLLQTFKWLKVAENAMGAHAEALFHLAPRASKTKANSPAEDSEIHWRLARFYYYYYFKLKMDAGGG